MADWPLDETSTVVPVCLTEPMLRRWPWPNSQMKKLTDHVRAGTDIPPGLPAYNEVMAYYDDLAAQVQSEIRDLDLTPLLGSTPIDLTSRAKTIDTLRQKLVMYPKAQLQTIQDVAGVRFEAEMSLDQQDAVVSAISGLYGDLVSEVKDMRTETHSGYRGVHIWLRLDSRVEVQVRTHLQGMWANVYESAADALGRNIRYDELPQDDDERAIVVSLRAMSTDLIAVMEENKNIREQIQLDMAEGRVDPSLNIRERMAGAVADGRVEPHIAELFGEPGGPGDKLHEQLSILTEKYEADEAQLMGTLTELRSMFIALRK